MIIGHERQIAYFERVLKEKKLAHAYLLYGPARVGKLAMAKTMAKSFYCENNSGYSLGGVCEMCSACKKIEDNMHLQVWLLDVAHPLVPPKDEEKRTRISIDDIHELRRINALAPEGENWRMIIVNDAETMSIPASNGFLKLLEEPGASTLIFLITSSRNFLLPTIISRTVPISFSLVSDESLAAHLEEKKVDKAGREELINLACGRPGVLAEILGEKDALARAKKLFEEVVSMLESRRMPDAFRLSERIAQDREVGEQAVVYLVAQLHKRMLSHIADGADFSYLTKIKRIDEIATLLETTNVQPRLALDVMFLEAQAPYSS